MTARIDGLLRDGHSWMDLGQRACAQSCFNSAVLFGCVFGCKPGQHGMASALLVRISVARPRKDCVS